MEKIVVIFVAIILMFFLSRKFILRYAPENIFILSMLSFCLGGYIYSVKYDIYIPLAIQIFMLIFLIMIPTIFTYLQYNNIILKRKLLYYIMKWKYFIRDYDKTIEYVNKLMKLEGRKAEYFYLLGQCYKAKKDFINSRDSFAMAVEFDRTDYDSYYELGLVLDETNKKDTAMVMFNNALRLKPSHYAAAEALGICLTSQAKYREAIKVYENALEHHPQACELYYNIAMIELELGDYDKAEEAFLKAGEVSPKLYSAHYNVGRINYLKGNYDKAIEYYKLSSVSTIYGAKSYYKLALVYAAKKEYEKAMSTLEYAIELEPNYLNEAKKDLVLSSMRGMILEYEKNREELLDSKKKNYMKRDKTKKEEPEEQQVELCEENLDKS